MQIRKLQRTSGRGPVSVWPPRVLSAAGTTFVRVDDGVLRDVKRTGNRLALTIDHKGKAVSADLEWDPPPSVAAMEKVLRAHLGEPITAIGYLDIR